MAVRVYATCPKRTDRFRASEPNRVRVLEDELRDLEKVLSGWTQSLGNPQLPPALRADLEKRYGEAKARQQELQHELGSHQLANQTVTQFLTPSAVMEGLQRLNVTLTEFNPTLVNLELSRHIDRIDCYADGRVELRGTHLGVFAGALELLSQTDCTDEEPRREHQSEFALVVPRRRTPLRVPEFSAGDSAPADDMPLLLDPARFAAVSTSFFWVDSFFLSRRVSWPEEHAEVVFKRRQEMRLSYAKLGKSSASHNRRSERPSVITSRCTLLNKTRSIFSEVESGPPNTISQSLPLKPVSCGVTAGRRNGWRRSMDARPPPWKRRSPWPTPRTAYQCPRWRNYAALKWRRPGACSMQEAAWMTSQPP